MVLMNPNIASVQTNTDNKSPHKADQVCISPRLLPGEGGFLEFRRHCLLRRVVTAASAPRRKVFLRVLYQQALLVQRGVARCHSIPEEGFPGNSKGAFVRARCNHCDCFPAAGIPRFFVDAVGAGGCAP